MRRVTRPALLVLVVSCARGEVTRWRDECAPCGTTLCLSSLCQDGACVAPQVARQLGESGWRLVQLPAPCARGPYVCSRDSAIKSLRCEVLTPGADEPDACTPSAIAAADAQAMCAPPRHGDIRLQSTDKLALLEQATGQLVSGPTAGVLMVYDAFDDGEWHLACADGTLADLLAAGDVACAQLCAGPATAAGMVDVIALASDLAAAVGPHDGRKASPMAGVDAFNDHMRSLFGAERSAVSATGWPVHSCDVNTGGIVRAQPRTLLACDGPPMQRRCSRTEALSITCSPGYARRPPSDGVLPSPTCGSGGDGAPPSGCARPPAGQCPRLFLPEPQVAAGGLYCAHYPISGKANARPAAPVAGGGRAALGSSSSTAADGLPAGTRARRHASVHASADGDRSASAEHRLHRDPLLRQSRRCAEAAHDGDVELLALCATHLPSQGHPQPPSAPPALGGAAPAHAPSDSDAVPGSASGMPVSPVVCFLGPAPANAGGTGGATMMSGILDVAGAPVNMANTTACSQFETSRPCPREDLWSAVLLADGTYLCVAQAPAPPLPPVQSNDGVLRAAGMRVGDEPFVMCHQSGRTAWPLVPRCVRGALPAVGSEMLGRIGLHLDPRPGAARPASSSRADPGALRSRLQPAAGGGALAPFLCGAGVYCPNLFNMTACPAGAYCWEGSVAPTPCERDLLAPLGLGSRSVEELCPPTSTAPPIRTDFVTLLALLALAVGLAVHAYDRARAGRAAMMGGALGASASAAMEGALLRELADIYDQARARYGIASAGGADAKANGRRPSAAGVADSGAWTEPPAMAAARAARGHGSAAVDVDDGGLGFAKLDDRVTFEFINLGLRVRAPAAVVARKRKAAAEAAATTAARATAGTPAPLRASARTPVAPALAADSAEWMKVVDSVSGSIEHSTLTAIMGVSGCGKSSFMNVLCGRAQYGLPTGTLLVNGRPAELEQLRSRLGFVPQDDTVREALTTYENLRLSAQLRLPHGTSSARIEALTREVIEMLGLQSVRDSVVGSAEVRGISGGQRKRVNIGLELAADPLALFLDEPTSGLDASTSELVLAALRKLSRRGRTIVAVLHQPRYSMFAILDKLLLLGVGGRTLFCGPPLKVVPYLSSIGYAMRYGENPADFMLDVVSGLVPTSHAPSGGPSGGDDGTRERANGRHAQKGGMPLSPPPSPPPSPPTSLLRAPPADADGVTAAARAADMSAKLSLKELMAQPGLSTGALGRVSSTQPVDAPTADRARRVARSPGPSAAAQPGSAARAPRVSAKPSFRSAYVAAASVAPTRTAPKTPPAAPAPRLSLADERPAPPTPRAAVPRADEPLARTPARPRGVAAAAPPVAKTGADGVVQTTAFLAAEWVRVGHTIEQLPDQAPPPQPVFATEARSAVLQAFVLALRAAWPQSGAQAGVDGPANGAADDAAHVEAAAAADKLPLTTGAQLAEARSQALSWQLARANASFGAQCERLAGTSSLHVADWGAFVERLERLVRDDLLSRAQVEAICARLAGELAQVRAEGAVPAPAVAPVQASRDGGNRRPRAPLKRASRSLLTDEHAANAAALSASLSRAELEDLLGMMDGGGSASQYDLNKDGKLSIDEFFTYQREVYGRNEAQAWVRWGQLHWSLQRDGAAGGASAGEASIAIADVGSIEAGHEISRRQPPSFGAQLRALTWSYVGQQRRLSGGVAAVGEWLAMVLVALFIGGLQRSQVPTAYEKLPTLYALSLVLFSLFVCARDGGRARASARRRRMCHAANARASPSRAPRAHPATRTAAAAARARSIAVGAHLLVRRCVLLARERGGCFARRFLRVARHGRLTDARAALGGFRARFLVVRARQRAARHFDTTIPQHDARRVRCARARARLRARGEGGRY